MAEEFDSLFNPEAILEEEEERKRREALAALVQASLQQSMQQEASMQSSPIPSNPKLEAQSRLEELLGMAQQDSDPRMAMMQERYGPQGFVFDRSPKGSPRITNTDETRLAVGAPANGEARAPAASPFDDLPAKMRAQIITLQQSDNPEARWQGLAEINTTANHYAATRLEGAITEMEVQLGLPRWEEQLQSSQTNDIAQGIRGASPTTMNIQTKISQLRSEARTMAEQRVAMDPNLISMRDQIAAAEKAVTALSNQDIRRQDRQANIEMQKELILTATPDAWIQNARVLDPTLGGVADVDVAYTINKRNKDPKFLEALQANPEEWAELALGKKNTHAEKLLVVEEARRTGAPEAVVADRLRQIRLLSENPGEMSKAIRSKFPDRKDATRVQADADLMLVTSPIGSKADKEAAAGRLQKIALVVEQQKLADGLMADAGKWGIVEPAFQDAIRKASEVGQPTAQAVFKAFVGTATGEERTKKQAEFGYMMQLALKKYEDSLLFPINSQLMWQQVQTRIITQNLLQRIESAMPETAITNTGIASSGIMPAGPYFGGMLDLAGQLFSNRK